MKKICTLAGALILVGLAGAAMGDETILPVIPFTNLIIKQVVEAIAEELESDPRDLSLLRRASNAYRDAVYGAVRSELSPGSEYDAIDGERNKELAAVRMRLLAGPMLLVPFWQERFVLEIEARRVGRALIPHLEEALRHLRGEATPKLRALQKRADLHRRALETEAAVLAKGGTAEEANEKEAKAWEEFSAHMKASGLGDGDVESFEWVERRRKNPGGAVILAVLAHGVGKILNELKALEAERARLPKMESPPVTAAPPVAQPSAAATGTGRSPFRR